MYETLTYTHELSKVLDVFSKLREAFSYARFAWARQINLDIFQNASRPIGHDQDAISQKNGLGDTVGYKDHRLFNFLANSQKFDIELISRQRVERAEWLVEQQNLRAQNESLSQSGALLHATGQFVRIALAERVQSKDRQDRFDALADFSRVDFLNLCPQPNICLDRQPGKKVVCLEYYADFV